MYRRTNMAVKLSEHDIFTKANAPIYESTNKSAATLGDKKSIILAKKQGLVLICYSSEGRSHSGNTSFMLLFLSLIKIK